MTDDSKSAYIVITHEECMNWITSGRLLFDLTRILIAEKGTNGTLDWPYFRILLDQAPYMGIEDSAYIITELKSDYSIINTGLHIKHVSDFIPMTDRSYRLTLDDFASKNFPIQKAKYEHHWKRWVRERIQNSATFRADEFLHLLGLSDAIDQEQGKSDYRAYFVNDPRAIVENNDDLSAIEETHWYGWYFALRLWIKEEDKKKISEEFNLNEQKTRLRKNQDIKKPFLESIMCDLADRIEKKTNHSTLPPLIVIATVIHYWMVFEAETGNVELDSLKKDLVEIGLRYSPAFSASVAYSIARKMPDEALTTLIYQKVKDLDISRTIKERRLLRAPITIRQLTPDSSPENGTSSDEGQGQPEIQTNKTTHKFGSDKAKDSNVTSDETKKKNKEMNNPTPIDKTESKNNKSSSSSKNVLKTEKKRQDVERRTLDGKIVSSEKSKNKKIKQ